MILLDWPLALGVLGLAILVDLLFGEYPNALHPVAWVGRLISLGSWLSPRRGRWRQLAAGALLALSIPALSAAAGAALLQLLREQPIWQVLVGVYLLKSTFALRCLGRSAWAVGEALDQEMLDQARHGLRSLCSRDPSQLQQRELASATVESLAENASDSFVAPLFYYLLLGLPGALFYRAVNTLDAMLGYRDERENLGKASARLDDLLNWLPSRLTAVLLLAAGLLRGKSVRRGWAIWLRDRGQTHSPNAGQPMAALAGLLGVVLEKPGSHRLGEPDEPLVVGKIQEAWGVVCLASLLGAGMLASAMGVIHACL